MKHSIIVLAGFLVIAGCSKVEEPTAVPMDQIVKLRITGPASIRADGVSTTTVQATIPREASSRNIKFGITQGTFENTGGKSEITVAADDQGVATATVIAGREVVVANVTATAGTFTVSTPLPQERAYAQTLTTETNSAFVKMDGTRNATITAILTRQAGVVSTGTRVTFEAFQQGQSAGRFFSVGSSDATGRATAVFTADANTKAGEVRIVVTTPTDSGGNLTSELTVTAQ